jgi:3-isopropylmalate dehydrogenase
MKKIVVLGGDGVGPEVTAAAVRELEAVSAVRISMFENALIGGAAYDAAGSPLPPATVAACKASTILLGAVGGRSGTHPKSPGARAGLARHS